MESGVSLTDPFNTLPPSTESSRSKKTHRERECERPRLMVARSLGSSPLRSDVSCSRIPRYRSIVVESLITLMPSFFEIAPPSLASPTMRVSSTAFPFLDEPWTSSTRNLERTLESLPSWSWVRSSTASAVDENRWIAFSLRLEAS